MPLLSVQPRRVFFIAEPYRPLLARLGLQTVEAMERFFLGPLRVIKPKVLVCPKTLSSGADPAIDVFYKQYAYPSPAWAFWGRRSKAWGEVESYRVFQRLGLPSAEVLAVGEERDGLGRLRRAFILTRTIPQAATLLEFLRGPGADRSRREIRQLRQMLIRQLAAMTRTIHRASFFHNDLLWRNVLVTAPQEGPPKLWWIDCPRGRFHRLPIGRRRRQIKDLASLDKPAGRWCTRGERVLFVRCYLGVPRLNQEGRTLIRRALDYRRRRWPKDWDEN